MGDATFKVVQFPRQAFAPGAQGLGCTAVRVPVQRWPRLHIRCPAAYRGYRGRTSEEGEPLVVELEPAGDEVLSPEPRRR